MSIKSENKLEDGLQHLHKNMNVTYPFSLLYREFPIYWLLESLNPLAPGVNGMDGLKIISEHSFFLQKLFTSIL